MRKTIMKGLGVISLLMALACTQKPNVFVHGLGQSAKPWLSEKFDGADGKFSFAIISDLNGGERPGIFDVAVEQLNLLRPELIISVGDLLDGETENEDSLKMEFERFDSRAARARAPFFHVGGNHDLTNPKMRQIWKDRYGAHYYYFIYKNVLFLVLDTTRTPDGKKFTRLEMQPSK